MRAADWERWKAEHSEQAPLFPLMEEARERRSREARVYQRAWRQRQSLAASLGRMA